jgi:uncharacterized protein (DUF58 family)
MIPTRRALGLLGAWGAIAVPAVLGLGAVELATAVWLACGVLLALVLIFDLVLGAQRQRLGVSAERRLPHALSIHSPNQAVVRVSNTGRRRLAIIVQESLPRELETRNLPRRLSLPPGQNAEIEYAVVPSARGGFFCDRLLCRVDSPLGLWWRQLELGSRQGVRVYPDFRVIGRHALLATDNRASQIGIRKRQRRGEGTEFHQLREYRFGDSPRQIDWRATSRMMKLISREYAEERDQQIVLLVDCGRRMFARDEGLAHLDHALEAVLLLGYVGLHQGDAVGMMTFGGCHRHLVPRKGSEYLNALMNASYDLQPTTAASDLAGAVREALKRLRRRSLIVLVTNLRDEDAGELTEMAPIAARRHVLLVASLRERILDETLREMPGDFDSALRLSATQRYLQARHAAHQRLEQAGVFLLDVAPQQLAVALVNRYLELKTRHAI